MIKRRLTVQCDGVQDDGIGCFSVIRDAGATQAEALKVAREQGWRRIRRDGRLSDLCPGCLQKEEAAALGTQQP